MCKYRVAAAAVAVAAAAGSANAGTYIPVPMVPGAVSEIAFSINNKNVVAGSFRDSANVEHGFFGPLDGSSWTTFDAPFDGTTGTEARSINDDGVIVGIATNPNFKVGEEFYRAPDGTFSVFEKGWSAARWDCAGAERKRRKCGRLHQHRRQGGRLLGTKWIILERFHVTLARQRQVSAGQSESD